MSGVNQNLREDVQTVLTKINNNEVHKGDKKSVSTPEKRIDLSSKFNSETRDVYDHLNSINSPFDKPIELEDHLIGSCKHEKEKVQQVLQAGIENPKLNQEEQSQNCPNEICKIKEAVELIVGEIKKVDAAIRELTVKAQCPYTPQPSDKKDFAKSVEKNSEVCHVIIDELKRQRKEINEMLEMYDESSREFLKLEETLKSQRENIDHIENILESVTSTLEHVKSDVAERHENFLSEMESRRSRVETREEILKVFLNWLMSLDAKRIEEKQAKDSMVKEAIEEREKDRKMLTAAINQLQEVKRIEMLLMTQHANTTRGGGNNINLGNTQQATMPTALCTCAYPINRVTIIPGQRDNARVSCASKINPGVFFNVNSNRCAGGADFLQPRNTPRTEISNENNEWLSQMPIGYHRNMQLPTIQQPRAYRGRRRSPIINARRRR